MELAQFGWNSYFARAFAPYRDGGARAARVVAADRGFCRVVTEDGEALASLSGRLEVPPLVGDWVVLRRDASSIEAVLPRSTVFERKRPGEAALAQPLAANLDVLLVVTGLDGDFNLRRIERYLVLARQSGADPVVVLSKADLLDAAGCEQALAAARAIASGAPVVLWSAFDPARSGALEHCVGRGQTAALVGSSGAGKSTLVNHLLGSEALETRAVRAGDDRGRHTTTRRQLFLLPQGWLLIDMPGLREVGLWAGEETVSGVFEDVVALAAACRYRDCTHTAEPGCAVLAGIEPSRLAQYHRLRREAAWAETQEDAAAQLARKRRDKRLHRQYRRWQRYGK